MPLTKRMWKFITLCAFLLAFMVLGTWVKATPKPCEPIPDFVNWATAQAPASAEIMLALDGNQDPNGAVSSDELARLNRVLRLLEKVFATSLLPTGGLQAADMDWLGGQLAMFGSFAPGEASFSGALIVTVRDVKAAKEKLNGEEIAKHSHFGTGWVCLATSDQALKLALDRNKPSLAQEVRFKKACSKLSHHRHSLVYLDLSTLAPRALASLRSRVSENKEQGPQLNFDSLEALASSLQCLVGGEDIVDNRVLADLFLCADVKNSGSLGRAMFDSSANIAHPAFFERSAQSQLCYASNVRYDYNIIYDLMGIHPLTAFFRSYPDALLAQKGLSLQDDILEGTLQGSMVSSVEKLDLAQLLALLSKSVENIAPPAEGKQVNATEQGEAIELANATDQVNTTELANATEQGNASESANATGDLSEQTNRPYFDLAALVEGCLQVWQQADWRVSLDLKAGALDKLSARNESVRSFVDGMLYKSGDRNRQEVLAQRFAYLPALNVVNNTLWVAGNPDNCAPLAPGKAKLGQKPALKILGEMCGTELCACQWVVDSRGWAEDLNSWAAESSGREAGLTRMLYGRGNWQCGRIVVVPEGLRVCEVVELVNSSQVR